MHALRRVTIITLTLTFTDALDKRFSRYAKQTWLHRRVTRNLKRACSNTRIIDAHDSKIISLLLGRQVEIHILLHTAQI